MMSAGPVVNNSSRVTFITTEYYVEKKYVELLFKMSEKVTIMFLGSIESKKLTLYGSKC